MTVDSRVEKLIREEVRELSAYHVPVAEGFVKLDAMENPYEWSDELKQEWLSLLNKSNVNRYPDASASRVKTQLRRVMHIKDEYDILLGNGSDEIIQLLALAVAKPGCTILAPEPCFVMYRMIASFTQMNYVGVALDKNFDLDVDTMLVAIKKYNPALIFIAQPNNPTGNLFDEKKIEAIIKASAGLVILDEAYTAFTDADFLPWLSRFDNVLIMRTLSKLGLAGLRLGLLVGSPEWINEIEKIRLPYNINTLTQVTAEFALMHYDVFLKQTEQLRQDRTILHQQLTYIKSLTVWASEANFLLVRASVGKAKKIHSQLKEEHQILVKCLDGTHPLLQDCLRLTVGTPVENNQLVQALSKIA